MKNDALYLPHHNLLFPNYRLQSRYRSTRPILNRLCESGAKARLSAHHGHAKTWSNSFVFTNIGPPLL